MVHFMMVNGWMIYLMVREHKLSLEGGPIQVILCLYAKSGTFKNGGKQGLGKLIFPDGSVYTGNFEFD